MRLSEITAVRFRNLSPGPFFFGSGTTVITGENAQGKTNLLEAVAVLSGQRSFRRARPSEMAAGGESFSIAATFRRGFEKERLRVEWSATSGRSFLLGQKPVSFREASRFFPAVFLAQEHRELIAGSPAVRRRFLDRLVLGLRPAGGDDLLRYERALNSRNALLSKARTGRPAKPGELEAWTEELVYAGTAVRRHRLEALEEWKVFFRDLASRAGPEYDAVSVSYVCDGTSEEELRSSCERLLPAERRRGYSLAGPHRDDLDWARGGRPMAGLASAGEIHRTAFLAKLAEWQAVEKAAGAPPLFGVDDFDAGLSEGSVEAFFEALPGGATVLLTSASDPARWRRHGAAILPMRAGRMVEGEARRAVND